MYLRSIELFGFKSFGKKTTLTFSSPITSIVGPNGSGKSNVAEAFRFVLGEQSIKSMRGKKGEDLIFNGTLNTPRASRASVKVTFDNTSRFLGVDFDEVVIEREVLRDGVNTYSMNGTQVRLRDVIEVLASAHVGSSGHHIISQGEADRILSANPRERKEMVEDALGLKVFQYKKQESEKKLEKTRENIAQVESLRKEIAPHLNFLSRQMAKIEKALSLKTELTQEYKEYLLREEIYLVAHEARLKEDHAKVSKEMEVLEHELSAARERLKASEKSDEKSRMLISLERELAQVRNEKDQLGREIGRLEGQIAFAERTREREEAASKTAQIPRADVERVVRDIEQEVDLAGASESISRLRQALSVVRNLVKGLLSRATSQSHDLVEELNRFKKERSEIEQKIAQSDSKEKEFNHKYLALKSEIEAMRSDERGAERELFSLMTKQGDVRSRKASLDGASEMLSRERAAFENELKEGAALIGREILAYKDAAKGEFSDEPRMVQEERRKKLERMKVRLEELGAGGADEVAKEFKEVKERDEFLTREIADLEKSAESLMVLIKELEEKLSIQFSAGIEKISKEFEKFFTLMFGGGSASLTVLKEKKRKKSLIETEDALEGDGMPEVEEEGEEGIEISINLPRKRIKGLEMLSGGERALTSIALIFAMSQVNPPPFLILDETDAALDEANSRRYGDMIESLSKKSQLILITHNRETMSRAGVLYGVTMGSDGISRLLSVSFEEAAAVAK